MDANFPFRARSAEMGTLLAADRHPISNGMASISTSSSGGDQHSKLDEVTRADISIASWARRTSSKQGPGDRDPLEIVDLDRFLVRFDDPASDLYAGRSWLLRV
jgi:hypothetical protein